MSSMTSLFGIMLLIAIVSAEFEVKNISKLERNKVLSEGLLEKVTTVGLHGCIRLCLSTHTCEAMSYDRHHNLCSLGNSNLYSNSTKTPTFYGTRSVLLSLIDPGPCIQHDCPLNMRCFVLKNGNTTCIFVYCDKPEVPEDMKIYNHKYPIGGVTTFVCSKGKSLFPVYCKSNNTWTNITTSKECCNSSNEYFAADDTCFTLRADVTHEEARRHCSHLNGSIIKITNIKKAGAYASSASLNFTDATNNHFWIDGLQIDEGKWTFQNGDNFTEVLQMFSGTPPDFHVYDENSTCLAYADTGLVKVSCLSRHVMFCETPKIFIP